MMVKGAWFCSGDRRAGAPLLSLLLLLLAMGVAGSAAAHGTIGKRVERRSVCLLFAYDDEEPMSYCKVTVEAPGSTTPYQSLATDRNGVACFAPDGAGDWRVAAGDSMGHQQLMVVSVADGDQEVTSFPQQETGNPGTNRTSRLIAGIGIICGLSGFFAWYRSRRKEET